jgi:hypothetical protein
MNANRAVIIDRWVNKDGKHASRYGVGMRWRARFVDDQGKEQTKAFARSKALVRLRDLVVGRASLQRKSQIPSIGAIAPDGTITRMS